MYAQKLETLPPPPGVINSLKAGFDVVSSHIMLILVPLVVDLFLWLGPRLSVNKIMGPLYASMFEQLRGNMPSAEDVSRLASLQDAFSETLQRFNLISLVSRLQTFPIGISSLLAKTMPLDSPLGSSVVEIPSSLVVLGVMLVLIIVGWIVGGLYFRWVSDTTLGAKRADVSPLRAIVQTFILSGLWLFVLMAVTIPLMLVLTVLMLISPIVASVVLFLIMLVSFWVIVPLFFTPHGIFVHRQNAFYSIVSSFRMARFTLPTSAMFVFSSFILSTGLNYLWSVPASNSWMTLVGIAGHAFITTALLAASFAYYRDMNVWLQQVIDQLQKKRVPARQL